MDKFGVPCPHCGSVRVIVSDKAEAPSVARPGGTHVPLLLRCACENCRHTFQHDFSFGS